MSTPIPQPPALPLIGNVLNIDPEHSMASLMHLAEKYGPIFKLNFAGQMRYFVSNVELCGELCDEKRFKKDILGPLMYLRPGIGDGLFTAWHGEPAWGVAHRTLVPAFGPMGIQGMFDEMFDIASQLVAKWARLGPDSPINVTDDFTRLTLDSIALCAMDRRFNSFYRSDMHPFVGAMVDFLAEGGTRTRKTRLESFIKREAERKFQEDIKTMRDVAMDCIEHRRANPTDKKDLLNCLLYGKDPKTGEGLTDESVMNNMLTFLIAGHETTGGTLSFICYYMMKHPETWQKAQDEVDRVVGKGRVKYEHMSQLPYLDACIREALRLQPTAPATSVSALPENDGPQVLGGRYTLPPKSVVMFILPTIHTDPAVYGPDAKEWNPDRMYGEKFTNLPPGAWKPFGNGARACIGRPFAWQEALLTLCLIMQNFNIRFADPSYVMKIKQTLTIKPDKLFMHATLREGIDPIYLEKRMFAGADLQAPAAKKEAKSSGKGTKPMTILYGSNSGTCEGLAQALASNADTHGFKATVKTLDSAVDRFPTNEPVIAITASYEGLPPDNAASFMEWLKKADSDKLKGAQFAVFGCGHKDWAATYMKVPTMLDEELAAKGGKALLERGEANVAQGKIFDDFDTWTDKLWPKLGSDEETVEEGLDMEVTTSARAGHLRHSVQEAVVLKNEILTTPGNPEKRRMVFKLPTDMTYEAGDYLGLLPMNNMPTITRVLKHFGLPWDATVTLKKGSHTTIPTDREVPISNILAAYVELNGTATKRNIGTLVKYGGNEEKLSLANRKSILDILEESPEIELPFNVYMSMLTPMRIRQYSISSSPLADPTTASITFTIVEGHGLLGVATNYLRQLQPGMTVQLSIKKSHASFHLPHDDSTPVIMVCAGTGLAPFMGFVEERATKAAAGKKMGEAALFIGCYAPTVDKLYAEQLEQYEKDGVVKVFYAYSTTPEHSKGALYAQDRLWEERVYAGKLFEAGGRGYICGSGRLGKGVADTIAKMQVTKAQKEGKEMTEEEAKKWWEDLRGERYAVDVFD